MRLGRRPIIYNKQLEDSSADLKKRVYNCIKDIEYIGKNLDPVLKSHSIAYIIDAFDKKRVNEFSEARKKAEHILYGGLFHKGVIRELDDLKEQLSILLS